MLGNACFCLIPRNHLPRVHRGLDHLGRINCYESRLAEEVGMDLMADRKVRAREGSPALCPFEDDQDEADPGSC